MKIKLDIFATIIFAVIIVTIGIKFSLMKKLDQEREASLQVFILEQRELEYQNSRLISEIYLNDIEHIEFLSKLLKDKPELLKALIKLKMEKRIDFLNDLEIEKEYVSDLEDLLEKLEKEVKEVKEESLPKRRLY